MPRPLLLGHRGARATRIVPENTILSFDQALAHGCDGFEFDVRMTADGQAVICHDAHAQGDEISQVEAQALRNVPLLEQILDRYAHRAFLDIELKVAGLEETVAQWLTAIPPQRGYVVSSFLPEVLAEVAKLGANLPLGLITEDRAPLLAWTTLPVSCVIPHHRLVDENLVRLLHAAGKKVFVWTVNDQKLMLDLTKWGVDALISDDTQLLVDVVGRLGT